MVLMIFACDSCIAPAVYSGLNSSWIVKLKNVLPSIDGDVRSIVFKGYLD